MALNGAPGFAMGKIFDIMLNKAFPRSVFHTKDSFEISEFLKNVTLKEGEVLVSFDIVSMFTNIPVDLVWEIVMENSDVFVREYGIGKKILKHILEFLLKECTVFTALEGIYKQKSGLPMGSCISPTLARMVMDRVVAHLLELVPEVNFIRVFVDDTITALPAISVQKALDALNRFNSSIRFTCEREDDNQSINFLNLTLIRENDRIITNWYRKYFASGRLLNFLSSHKYTTIIETGSHFIRTVIQLSDERFFRSNRDRVIETLHDNCFPETLILTLMNENYTLMRGRDSPEKMEGNFYAFPHAICESKRVKRILYERKKDDVIYAESTRNSKINFVRNKKTITPVNLRGNKIIITRCACNKKMKVVATNFNETAQMVIDRLITSFVRCTANLHAFRKFKIHTGLAYGSQTDILARYIQWKFRGKCLNTRTGRPQFHFVKLLKNN